jgi:hypothetical protein
MLIAITALSRTFSDFSNWCVRECCGDRRGEGKGIRGFCDNEGKGFQIVLRKVKVKKSEIWL